VATLRFEHGKANEVGTRVLRELERLVADIEADPDVVALITTSTRVSSRGTPLFVAGANVTERAGWNDQQVMEHVRWQRSVLRALRHAPVFHVVVVGGVALGWGTEYLLTADWRIATPGAVFGLPETGLGILPGAGGTAELWSHIGVAQTLRLGMTGERIGPDEARQIGLVQEVAADHEAGMSRALALAARAAKGSPTAVAAFKRAVLEAVGSEPSRRNTIEEQAYEVCVRSGEAAVGRENFAAIREGVRPPWGPKSGE
jgi:enoyl-CoA hydratase/carnithine racemase